MNKFSLTPFLHYSLAYDLISDSNLRVLDYGCGNGEFIGKISNKTNHLYGYDVDPEKIKKAKVNYPDISFKIGKTDQQLPYGDFKFDVVTMFHILEHVGSEKKAVSEVYRILKKDGLLLLASPYDGLFAWADAANLRYRFPNLHKWFFITFLGKSNYEERFVNRQSIGMYGDCTDNRNWHKHYFEEELRQLLKNKFSIVKIYKFSLFYPFLLIPHNIINYLFKPKSNPMLWLIHLDNLINAGDLSYNFFLAAKRK